MKLKKILPLCLITLLAGCAKKASNDLTILTPTGAPSVAFYNYATNKNFTTNATPTNIVNSMTSSGSDIVVIDTLSGIKAIKNAKAPYKLLATITFGNFYLVSTGHDENNTLDADDKVVLFGQGQTPDKLFNYLYPNFTNISFVSNVQEAGQCLCKGKVTVNEGNVDADYVFVAEPVLTNISNNNQCATYNQTNLIDIQEIYKEKTDNKLLTQASIFVKNGTKKEQIKKFAESIQKDIEKAIETPQVIEDGMNRLDAQSVTTKYGIGAAIAKAVMEKGNRLGLGFEYAIDIKADIDAFIALFNATATLESEYVEK